MKKQLLIFRHTPIDVEVKMYEYFAQNLWEGSVIVYAETSFKDCRSVCGYKEYATGINTIIIDQNDINFNCDFFENHKMDIFLFYGIPFANKFKTFLVKYNIQFGIIAERDWGFYNNNKLKTSIKKAIPYLQYLRYYDIIKNLSFFLAMGKVGVDCYEHYYKVSKNKLFTFMYCDGNDYHKYREYQPNSPIKFIYVGRFDYKFKGVDIMLDAFQNLEGDYVLDLVGDYGDERENILNRVNKMKNINCIGICEIDKICKLMNNYDIIIVPSKYDGWNLHCNLSINAGIGIISTDQAGSQELVETCGNGVVIEARNVVSLKESITNILNNPSIINEWKIKTSCYSSKISYKIIAKYLYDVLMYSIYNPKSKEKPMPPWIIL